MVAALELYLDTDATRRLRALWQALEAEAIPTLASLQDSKHRPHVSLAAGDRLATASVAAALGSEPVGSGLALSMDFVGQFVGRVLWLGVTPSAELLARH